MDFLKFHLRFSGNRDSGENLKKVLALVLAFACAFTMFAGAAFTDSADIKVDAEVVDTLVSLGVVNGYDDGSFKPNGTVTRAEMAKMIYVLRTGNSDASAYNDDKTSFTDIGSHWARGYIKYCQSLGIIAGKSNTKFCPNDKVTAQEAAKMLLVTLGYDATKAGLVGVNWASRTNALADEAGLLDDVNTSFTGPCPRQYAAQLIYNAIDAPTVVWRDDAYHHTNVLDKDNQTIGEKYMGLKKTVGILSSVTKQDNKDTYDLTIDANSVNEDESSDKYLTSFTKVAKDYSSLKYNTVKVLYKAKDNVYGVFATDDNTVQSGLLSDMKYESDRKVKLNGTKYDLAKDTSVYVDGELVQTVNKDGKKVNFPIAAFANRYSDNGSDQYKTYKEGTSVELIAADGSSDYSILKVKTYKVAKVTFVGSDYVNTKAGKFDDDEYVIASGLKKDDYVVITEAGNYADKDGRIEKAEVVEGKVVGIKGNDKVQIGDNWYTMATGVNQPAMSANVKLIIVNGYAYEKDTISAGSEDVALVVKLGESSTVGSKYYQARMIFSDGTDKTVDVEKKDGNGKALGKFDTYDNTLVTYDISKNVYTITAVTDKNSAVAAGYDEYKAASTVTVDNSVRYSDGRVYFEDDAIVFVAYKNGDYKVVTGKSVAGWKETKAKTAKSLITLDNTTKNASVAFIDLDAANVPGGSDTTYAVALDKTYTKKIDGTTYYFTKAWNGTEEVTYKSEDTKVFAKGDVFEYSADGADTVSVDKVAMTNTQVASYSNGDISFKDDIAYTDQPAGTSAKLNAGEIREIDSKDTVVLYVDSDNAKGVGDGEIRVGNAYNNAGKDTDKANVSVNIAYGDGFAADGYVTVIVVDVNNNIEQW